MGTRGVSRLLRLCCVRQEASDIAPVGTLRSGHRLLTLSLADAGRTYYLDPTTGKTVWEKPDELMWVEQTADDGKV